MYNYKYEIHIHTSACSACATSSAREMVYAAKENGYTGIVFSNHFYFGNTAIDRTLVWEDFVDTYNQDYLDAKKLGDALGIEVIFAIEDNLGDGKEALIYGIEPHTIAQENAFIRFTLAELSNFVHQNGGILVAAHPFREASYIKDPDKEPDAKYYDGIEVYNKHNTPEQNEKANIFAEKHQLLKLSGGDIHSASDFGRAGLAFDRIIKTSTELVEAIKSQNYKCIKGDELFDPL